MSGIFGIYYLDGQPVERENLVRMADALAHRGPDGADVWCSGPVGLGHRMLWTTPESLLEKLPLVNRTGELVITADARLDNRSELLAALDCKDCPSEKITDSQLILAAYEKWGEQCPEQLLGDFAFAIWDGRKQRLFGARDHFGVKPFYYYTSGRAFIFATEIKALLCLGSVPRQLNEVKVADYLIPLFEDKEITFYQDIFRLPPAHSLTVSGKELRLQPYWSLDPERELRLGSDQEYAEAFRELFTEAVGCRLRSAFPLGSLLSGGLDSSSVTCTARELLPQEPLHSFSAVFDQVPQCDERPFIEAVLAQGAIEPHWVRADQLGPLTDLDRVLWHQDEAFYAPNLFIHWSLYRAAKSQGVRALLDGFDGDTVVSHGVAYLSELARAGKWLALAGSVRGFARNFNRSPGQLLWRYLWRYGLGPLVPQPLRRVGRKLRSNRSARSPTLRLNPDLARRIALKERIQAANSSSPPQTARSEHYRRLSWGVIPFTLEVADRAAAAFSIEPRFPFFDKRLAEFCLALPPEQKMHRGWTRVVMRRALAGILPVEVQWRGGKSNLSHNFHRSLRLFERERLEQVIWSESALLEEYVDISVLRQTYQRFAAGEPLPDSDVLSIWKPVSLALWLRSVNSQQSTVNSEQ